MEIRHFVTFNKIIEVGSFTQAAIHLGYTQSTVTSHIQALEEQIGAPIFDRIGRRIQLTDIGKKLLPHAKEMITIYQKIERLTNDGEGMTGELKIAAPESITVYRLEPILKEFKKQFPLVQIRLINATCSNNKKSIMNGQADIAFVMLPPVEELDLSVHSLMKERVVLVGNPNRSSDFFDLIDNNKLNECFIIDKKEASYWRVFEAFLRDKGIVPTNIMELFSIEAIKRSVMSGLGIAYLPFMSVQDEIKDGRLKIIPLGDEIQPIQSQIIYHRNKWISPILSSFLDITLKHAQNWPSEETTRNDKVLLS